MTDERAQSEEDTQTETVAGSGSGIVEPLWRRHLNRLHRRAIALLIDRMIFDFTLGSIVQYFVARLPLGPSINVGDDGGPVQIIDQLIFLTIFALLRDALPGGSPGRRWLGLRLQDARSELPRIPSYVRRVLRNLIVVLPAVFLIEFLIARFDRPHQRRLGDRWTATLVLDRGERGFLRRGSIHGSLAIALIAWGYLELVIGPDIYNLWEHWLKALGV